ncbi:B12-binding domain-containing radical SAM protein [Acetonema longum]|uniref:Radical SAM domain protein n=1 Tax=Acetonema longum DSM 6540 TaxID=1009370 RepID=F7NLU1_9FIRM|nr:cobalamin-dependent protein [Acetonema longum]EGO63032.1 radical SAM domain protein [Acetonema longum DSM 6540]
MKPEIDLLLVNSMAPRQRIASDAALENSLAILRTYLEDKAYRVEVMDEQRISGPEAGVPAWCLKLLRLLVRLQMATYRKEFKYIFLILMLSTWPVQALSLYYRTRHINGKINDIIRTIRNNRISLLGIKLWYGDSFRWSKLLAAKVREACPEVIIVAGGPQVKVYGEHVFHETKFDVAILGPGEEVLEKMIALQRQTFSRTDFFTQFEREISRSRLVQTGIYNPAGLPAQNQSLTIPRYRPEDMRDKLLFHTLVDGMGCSWNRCNFCSHTRQASAYQPRPVPEIIREFQAMSRQGISFFRFSSSETPPAHGKKIAQAILEHDLTVNYSMFVRPVRVTPAIYDAYCLMIQSGLRAVFMGGETGHDLINETVMNKGVRKKEIVDTINCIKLAAAAVGKNCRIGLSLIYPTPVVADVTLQDVYEADIRLIQETLPDTVIVNPPGVFPHTAWMENAGQFGFAITPDFVFELMQYEYSIYKPVEFWGQLGFSLQGKSTPDLIKETGKLRNAIAEMGIPTDISDEYLMMTEAIGYTAKVDLLRFKRDSLQDIMSGSSRYMREVIARINIQSRQMADGSLKSPGSGTAASLQSFFPHNS